MVCYQARRASRLLLAVISRAVGASATFEAKTGELGELEAAGLIL